MMQDLLCFLRISMRDFQLRHISKHLSVSCPERISCPRGRRNDPYPVDAEAIPERIFALPMCWSSHGKGDCSMLSSHKLFTLEGQLVRFNYLPLLWVLVAYRVFGCLNLS